MRIFKVRLDQSQRLDRWLFFARIFKSRSLAQAAIEQGRVWVDGKTALKPSDTVKAGDKIVVAHGPAHRWLTVLAPGDRRGPAPEAATLYREDREPGG